MHPTLHFIAIGAYTMFTRHIYQPVYYKKKTGNAVVEEHCCCRVHETAFPFSPQPSDVD